MISFKTMASRKGGKDLIGSPFNDVLKPDSKKTTSVFGRGGNDVIERGNFQTHLFSAYEEEGDDEISTGALGIYVDGGLGNDTIVSYVLAGFQTYGSTGDDSLTIIRIEQNNSKPYKSYAKRDIIIDGGEGADRIKYTSGGTPGFSPKVGAYVRGGEGDDEIYLNETKIQDRVTFYGDGGNDNFVIDYLPEAPNTKFYGGTGVDRMSFDPFPGDDDENNLISAARTNPDLISMTFVAYTQNGIAYTQTLELHEIEQVFFGANQFSI